MKNSLLGISVICALLLSASGLRAQSPTTASAFTIKNPAGETVTLRIPAGGVTPYSLIYPAAQPTVGSLMTFITGGSSSQMAWLSPGTNLQVLQMVGSSPAWQTINVLPGGTTLNATLVWNGTSWVENTNVTMNPTTGDVNIALGDVNINGGDLTVTTGDVIFPNGVINNNELQNSSVTINTGTGLSGGGNVPLGGTLNLVNTGVTSAIGSAGIGVSSATGDVTFTNLGLLAATAGTGIGVSTTAGNVTITNTGVTQAIGTTNQVNVSPGTGVGNVTFSLPQDIHLGATPTFAGATLTALTANNAATEVVVSTGGVLQTRSISTIGAGTGEPFLTFAPDGGSLTNNRVATAGSGISFTNSGADNGTLTIENTGLLTATAGTGIGVSITAGNATITNTGVTAVNAGPGISLSGGPTGSVTVNNAGVLSVTGTANQVTATPTSGAVVLTLPQDIDMNASPTFDAVTLDNLTANITSNDILVRGTGGLVQTRSFNLLPTGTVTNSTLVWNGTSWVENTLVTMNPSSGDVTIGGNGDLIVNTGGDVTFPNGVINNNELQNSSVTINTGTGLSGGGVVALGGTLNLANTGVTSIAAGPGISVSGGTGAVTVNNTGVTQAIGTANQVNVSPVGGTGNVTFSLPQDIHTNASPTFDGLTLDALTTNNAATDVIVSTGGVLQTRSISTIGAGTGEPFLTFAADGGSLTNNRVLTAGTGVTITSGGVDNAPTTVAIGQDVATTASPTFTNVTLNGMPSGSTSTDIVVSNGGVLETRSLTSVLPTSGRVSTASATNGGSSWSMVIGNAAVTGTNTIILTYEDPSGGTNKTVHIAGRTVGADFTVQFSGKPAPGSFVNYSILP